VNDIINKPYTKKLGKWLSKMEFNYLAPTAITTQLLRKQLKKTTKYVNGHILDVGCGMRPYEQIFLPYTDKYVGLDIVAGPRVDIVADSTKKLPCKDEAYDTVICTEMLEHTPYPRESIREISRVIKDQGHIILSTPFTHKLHGEPYDYFRFSQHILKIILQEAKLEPLEIHYVGTSIAVLGREIGDIIYAFSDIFRGKFLHKIIRLTAMPIVTPIVWFFYILDCAASKFRFLKGNTLGFVIVAEKTLETKMVRESRGYNIRDKTGPTRVEAPAKPDSASSNR